MSAVAEARRLLAVRVAEHTTWSGLVMVEAKNLSLILALPDREVLAREIEPDWFGEGGVATENYPGQSETYRAKALAAADRILQLLKGESSND